VSKACVALRPPRPGFGRVVALSLLAFASAVGATPYRPQDPDTVLLRVDAERAREARAARVNSKSRDVAPDVALEEAHLRISRGREEIDERYFGQAEALLRRTLTCVDLATLNASTCPSDRTTIGLLVALADVLQHRHEFQAAETLLATAIERAPRHPQAHLMRANIRFAAGRADEALSDCKTLVGLADTLIASTCIAQAMGMTGQLARAYELVTRMTDSIPLGEDPGLAWALAIRAEMQERRGDASGAAETILRAVAADPRAYPGRLQAADTLIRASHFAGALEVLEPLPATAPVLLRRALASRGLGLPQTAALIAAWRERLDQERNLRAPLHLRDMARGQLELLEDPQAALAAAKENWKSQRELEDARLLLTTAAAAGRPEEGRSVRRWLIENKVEDALIAGITARSERL
jgi:tetratricopeptide (TPR) repeat protein